MARPSRTIALAIAFLSAAGSAVAADATLIAAARKEGEVNWYSTQIISQLVRPVTAAFEKKYSGIKVRATRQNATEVAVKIINEGRAGRVQADVVDGTTTVVALKKEGLVLQWLPDAAGEYPADVKDPTGYWIANNLFIITTRLQHEPCSTRHGAEDLSGPAQPEMARQACLERSPDQFRRGGIRRHGADRHGAGGGHCLFA